MLFYRYRAPYVLTKVLTYKALIKDLRQPTGTTTIIVSTCVFLRDYASKYPSQSGLSPALAYALQQLSKWILGFSKVVLFFIQVLFYAALAITMHRTAVVSEISTKENEDLSRNIHVSHRINGMVDALQTAQRTQTR